MSLTETRSSVIDLEDAVFALARASKDVEDNLRHEAGGTNAAALAEIWPVIIALRTAAGAAESAYKTLDHVTMRIAGR